MCVFSFSGESLKRGPESSDCYIQGPAVQKALLLQAQAVASKSPLPVSEGGSISKQFITVAPDWHHMLDLASTCCSQVFIHGCTLSSYMIALVKCALCCVGLVRLGFAACVVSRLCMFARQHVFTAGRCCRESCLVKPFVHGMCNFWAGRHTALSVPEHLRFIPWYVAEEMCNLGMVVCVKGVFKGPGAALCLRVGRHAPG